MTQTVPKKYHDLLEKKVIGTLATIMPDGSPQATPVWFDTSNGDGYFLVNSAKGRQKDKNMRKKPSVALTLVDPDNPYRYIEIRGKVEEATEKGASEHIDQLAKKYLGEDKYPYAQPGEVRVIYKIKPDRIVTWG
jgi:PPOX class probable F420-dependent enzyme